MNVRQFLLRMDRLRQQEHLRILHELHLAVTSQSNLGAVLDLLLGKIDLLLSYDASVSLLNPTTGKLEPVACRNIDPKAWKDHLQNDQAERRHEVALKNRTPWVVRDAARDPRTSDTEFLHRQGVVSYIALPLVAEDETLGVLSLYTKKEHEFADDEVGLLTTFAEHVAAAIRNCRLYEEAKKQVAELDRTSRLKTEFLGAVSHGLRTSLNMIMGYTSLVQDRVLGEINPAQQKCIGKALRYSNDLLTMINGLVEATRIEAGAVVAEKQPLDLKEFLDQLKSLYDIALDKEADLVWDYAPALPVLMTDPEKLKQILQNLINNVLKFCSKGRVVVSVRSTGAGGSIEFRVAGTGMGVSQDSLPVIFDLLREINSPEMKVYGSIGLGLYIVKTFTTLIGGSVTVESLAEEGAAFTVTLPSSLVDK